MLSGSHRALPTLRHAPSEHPGGAAPALPLPSRGERGFTLAELAVSLLVLVEVILGALMIFDFNSKLANVQTQVTDMQQSLRAAQLELVKYTRMAGRGGLTAYTPSRTYPLGGAVEVRDNVGVGGLGAPSTSVAAGFANSPVAVTGTDILIVRGVINNSLYQIDWSNGSAYGVFNTGGTNVTNSAPQTATTGVIHVCDTSPANISQSTAPLAAAITSGFPEALILTSQVSDSAFAVVELNPGGSLTTSTACTAKGLTGVTLAFNVTGDQYATAYRTLSSVTASAPLTPNQNLPILLTKVAMLGVLEEYRYYVRSDHAVPGLATSEALPRLSRARVYPGTELPYAGDATNLQVDVADNILDLQVALGIDKDGDGVIVDNSNTTDEWLYNAAGDVANDAAWLTVAGSVPVQATRLLNVRISTLAKTARRDPMYTAPQVTQIEDNVYNTSPPQNDPLNPNTIRNSMFRRRLLQTIVGPRNL